MPKSEKIALVTGANKGIGFEAATGGEGLSRVRRRAQ
jgi:short-subunit dehydrogenase